MQAIAGRLLRICVAPVALIIAMGLLGTVRPVLRFHKQRTGPAGVHQRVLLADTAEFDANDQRPPTSSGLVANQYAAVAVLALLVTIVTIVLKARRTAFVPHTLRRLKLPRATTDSSSSS